MLGKLICLWKGKHLRGRSRLIDDATGKPLPIDGHLVFFCPRCGRETRYKAKAQA